MPLLHSLTGAIYLTQILGSALLAILFLQSGIDKVVDHRGNLEWLKGHFAKSPLAGVVPVLLTAITLLEITAGALSAIGCLMLIVSRETTIAFYGADGQERGKYRVVGYMKAPAFAQVLARIAAPSN